MLSKALFLDRDGIINKDNDFVFRKKDFIFNEEIFGLIKFFQDKNYKIIIVTNQSGIGRGLFTLEEFYKINRWMIDFFKDKGLVIDRVYFCPFHPSKGIGEYLCDHDDRKPNPGMILKAKKKYDIDLKKSYFIGDRWRDIGAGNRAKCKTIFIDRKYNEKNIFKAKYNIKKIKEIINIIK